MFEHLKSLVAAQTARTGKRRTIHLTDDTLRDAQQCLWATRMRTEHMLPIAERIGARIMLVLGTALVRTVYCVSPIFAVPDGKVRFCAFTALTTSVGVRPLA